ncbi:YbaK family protein [Bacillus massilinigeriensis]|uniref:YbaK family protein n=1 Tax=Bacillus mediterraneensis TaxID=1805474 RepID=UPI0008F801D0|nr:YbaK family protein [Bacillus mediterraneensis]
MNVVTTFKEKKREKQIKYERSMLRELSLKKLQERVKGCFGSSRLVTGLVMNKGIEEACYDVAIEAFLLGARFGRFGYHGEQADSAKLRCSEEELHLVDTLYNFFLFWGNGEEGPASESLYSLCEKYVDVWWRDGFSRGELRHKLRLH